jgi:hypothetical protein
MPRHAGGERPEKHRDGEQRLRGREHHEHHDDDATTTTPTA